MKKNTATAETQLENEFNYRALADSGQALIWKARLDKSCDYFNKVWLDFTGRTTEQELGNGWTEGIHPDDYQCCYDTYVSSFDKREPFSMNYRLRRHDGEYRWIQDDGSPRYSSSGEFLGYIGYCLDITEHKLAEKNLQDRNDELERFTYTVSHDLKSPLITIQSFVGQVMHDFSAGKFERIPSDLDRISAAATKMTALLNDLLKLSRIGRILEPPCKINMDNLVKEVLTQLAGPLKEQQVEVTIQESLPAVYGDRQRISMVVQNLLENAVKYMGDQTTPRIEIGVREEDKVCIFIIRDNGKGVDQSCHEIVFELFKKLDTKSEGTGIGLALVKRIIDAHGGNVWVESEGAGKGSAFCFSLAKHG